MKTFPIITDHLGNPSPYTHVLQKGNWDCVLAAAAIWTKKTYEEVMEVYNKLGYDYKHLDSQKGCSSVEKYMLLKKLGVEPFTIDEAFGSVPGILSMPSMNRPGGAHAIFYDGRNLWDPQYGKEDKKWYEPEHGWWPSCFRITIDLNDEYSYEMAEMWLAMKKGMFNRAPRTKAGKQNQSSDGVSP
jgi:hypothetical protein